MVRRPPVCREGATVARTASRRCRGPGGAAVPRRQLRVAARGPDDLAAVAPRVTTRVCEEPTISRRAHVDLGRVQVGERARPVTAPRGRRRRAPTTTGCPGRGAPAAGRGPCRPARSGCCERRVVEREHQVGRGRGAQPLGDDLPRLEPVGERDHGVVVAERRADRGPPRRSPRSSPAARAPARPGTLLRRRPPARRWPSRRRRGRRAETTATRRPRRARSRANSARSASTLLSEPCRRWPGRGRHPVEVGGVADEVVGRGERAARLAGSATAARPGRCRRRRPRPGRSHGRRSGHRLAASPTRLGSTATAKYGTDSGSTSASGGRALARHRGALDVDGVGQPPGVARGPAHGREGAAELHHHRGVGGGEPRASAPPRAGCRAGRSAPRRPRPAARPSAGAGGADRGDPGHDLGGVAVRQPLVHVHVGAVEERVALGEHRHVAAGVEVGGQPAPRPRRRTRRWRPGSRRGGRWSRS